jgi:hypothetical protein
MWCCHRVPRLGAAKFYFASIVLICGFANRIAAIPQIGRREYSLVAGIGERSRVGKINHEKRHAHCYDDKSGAALAA